MQTQPVTRLSLKLQHLGQFCFEIDIMLFSDSYMVSFKTKDVPFEHQGQEFGNYSTGDQIANYLNVTDMVQWVVDNLSPHVLALMTREAPTSEV
jgi:hypothetical protein